jgi:hypothetical protein
MHFSGADGLCQTYAAGEKAMPEWIFRRVGLGLLLLTNARTLVGLGLDIKNLEQK